MIARAHRIRRSFALLFLLAPAPARAATIYGDGLPHAINAPLADSVQVSNGSALLIVGSAAIGPPAAPPSMGFDPGLDAITATGSTTSLVVSGGTITGGTGTASYATGGAGVVIRGGGLSVTGGTITGGAGFEDGPGIQIGSLVGPNAGPATISGGTVSAGDQGMTAGGGFALYDYGPSLIVTGGTFNGWTTRSAWFEPVDGSATIGGGHFNSTIVALTDRGGSITFLGSLRFLNGTLSGTLSDGEPINVPIITDTSVVTPGPAGIRFAAAVPEPSSLALSAIAGLVAVGYARRRTRIDG